jgi:glycosyltransferase involved in cell wall biosynthesis
MDAPEENCGESTRCRVLFAPDFRAYVPYQKTLADALAGEGVDVSFSKGYRRGLPLTRGLADDRDAAILHLHWPAFYFSKGGRSDALRKLRFLLDVEFAARAKPLVYSLHDLHPTDFEIDALIRAGTRRLLSRSRKVICHSAAAAQEVSDQFGIGPERCTVIPHGDLAGGYGPPLPKDQARSGLAVPPDERVCLAFGYIAPNKGLEELIDAWKRLMPDAQLYIVGNCHDTGYACYLNGKASDAGNVSLQFGFVSDRQVRLWFSAADCVVVNYRRITTSGVAVLARSYGIPILVPERLVTVDLMEPDPSVFRFRALDGGFLGLLDMAMARRADHAGAAPWRERTAWSRVAAATASVYRAALGHPVSPPARVRDKSASVSWQRFAPPGVDR